MLIFPQGACVLSYSALNKKSSLYCINYNNINNYVYTCALNNEYVFIDGVCLTITHQ